MIPYGRQNISENDISEVIKVLQSDFITQGPIAPSFEKEMCEYTGAKFACAVNSATSALHIACLALGLKSGDSLWTSPNSFVASSNCALYCGARVDFVDIDPDSYNMSASRLEDKLKWAKLENCLPLIVVPVHFSGMPCDMKRIYELSKEYGFSIIEDASHAVGADYHGSKVGACVYSDVTIFSFHPVKIITTGEGGLALTNSEELAHKMSLYRSHGITKDETLYTADFEGAWKYEQIELGFNYRMTDIQAALGISQLKRLNDFVLKRRSLVKYYSEKLAGNNHVIRPVDIEDRESSWHLYVIKLNAGVNREEVFNKMRESGIGVNIQYIPIHLQPYYKSLGFKKGDFSISEKYYEQCLTLPLYPDLTCEQIDYIVNSLFNAIGI